MALKTVFVDGLPVETTDAGEAAINKLRGMLDSAGRALEAANSEHAKAIAAKDAELGQKDARIKELEGQIVTGDALTHPTISFVHPEWKPAADHVPDQAVTTRKQLLDRLATDNMKIIGFHLPYPGIGMVERKDGAYRYVAA